MRPSLVILTAVAFFLGYMASEAFSTPKPVTIENMPYCLHSEYPTMKAMRAERPPLDDTFVEITEQGVRVWARCE